jgi:ribokinase
LNIFTIGSLNLDYVYTVDHFVRPGETLSALKREIFPGGKGLNQSIALARAGVPVYHGGCIGHDGGLLLQTLKEAGADISLVEIVEEPTGHTVIQVDTSGENCILLYGGANHSLTPELLEQIFACCKKGDILLLQNEVNALPEILRLAGKKGIFTALNPSPWEDSLRELPLESVRWFLLNRLEGEGFTEEKEPEHIAAALRSRYPQAAVVLTLGAKGALYSGEEGDFFVPAFPVKAVDTTGAGDTFTGYFLASIREGLSPEQAMRRGCLASSIAVTRKGAAPSIPLREEVLQAEKSLVF